jgi:hypothetical protein
MIDTQQQYINLNIRGEIPIIVVQAHSGRKRVQTINAILEAYDRIVSRVKLWRMGVKYL